MLLCFAAASRRTWYGYANIKAMLKQRESSDGLRTCILRMLDKDPEARYSVKEALNDPWLLEASKLFHPSPAAPPLPSPLSSASQAADASKKLRTAHPQASRAALAPSNVARRDVNRPAAKSVFSPRKTRAGTKLGFHASNKQGDPVPLAQHGIKPDKKKTQMAINTNHSSASKGKYCVYGT